MRFEFGRVLRTPVVAEHGDACSVALALLAADPADRRRSLAVRLPRAVRFDGAGGQEVTAASADRMPPRAGIVDRSPHLISRANRATSDVPGPDSHGFTGRKIEQATLAGSGAGRWLSTSRNGTCPSERISAPASNSRLR